MELCICVYLWFVFLLAGSIAPAQAVRGERPNIVFVLADDVGWADVSWNNKEMRNITERLNTLSTSGTILSSLYTLPVCTPSRAALLTGIYPFRYGLQRGYGDFIPNGLPTGLTLLPSYLQEAGYKTHMLGKWHLGHCDTRYTPRHRGFDTFVGSYSGAVDHWTRLGGIKGKTGYDLRNGTDISHVGEGLNSAQLYSKLAVDIINNSKEPYFLYVSLTMVHAPFQDLGKRNSAQVAPKTDVRNRMLHAMDNAVGRISEAIDKSSSSDNTILIFMSDNGGKNFPGIKPNLPLKGGKGALHEGGTRVPGFIRGGGITSGRKYSGLMHMVDWVPTLIRIAGGVVPEGLDGLDQSDAIWKGAASPRHDMVYNIDEGGMVGVTAKQEAKWQIGVRKGSYKLISGSPKMLKRDGSDKGSKNMRVLELYNLDADPYERKNIIKEKASEEILGDLNRWAIQLVKEMVPVNSGIKTALGYPANLGGIIGSGWCRAVLSSWCSGNSSLSSWFSKSDKPVELKSKGQFHLYTAGKAVLYSSPLLENEPRACFVKLERGEELDLLL